MGFSKEHLQAGEEVLALANPHILTIGGTIVTVIAALLVCIVAATIVQTTRWLPISGGWFFLAWLPFLGYLLLKLKLRRFEQYIITTHRVIKQEGFFSKSSFDAPLDKINNIFYKQSLAGRFFKYGDVGLETASEQGTTYFANVPEPIRFRNILMEAREAYVRRQARPPAPAAPPPEDVPAQLERLSKLRSDHVITEAEFQESKRKLLGKL